jgi:hypothetical protein
MLMETESINNFRQLLTPWQIYVPERDSGIDLTLWPYIGEGENEPADTQLLVQMKSTRKKKLGSKKGISMQFETEHLIGWKKQRSDVLVVLNDLNRDEFHYFWADQIKLNEKQKTNTVFLPGDGHTNTNPLPLSEI